MPHENYRLGLPLAGRWQELINTDAEGYGGSGVGNLGEVTATDASWHGQPSSATVRVPPLGTIWLKYLPEAASAEVAGCGYGRGRGPDLKSVITVRTTASAFAIWLVRGRSRFDRHRLAWLDARR